MWEPAGRPDVVALLRAQDQTRIPELVAVRYGRMIASPLAFLRGSAAVMAADLATTPVTGLRVQALGDAHLLNFGVFGTPERHLVFDANDFDETTPAPWEWDVKRLAASLVLASRHRGFGAGDARASALAAVRGYRKAMRSFATLGALELWYTRLDVDEVLKALHGRARRDAARTAAKARSHDSTHLAGKLTEIVDGRRRFRSDPPLLVPVSDPDRDGWYHHAFLRYRRTLQANRQHLLNRFRFAGAALKVVGVGSVGTRCLVVLLEGEGDDDPLLLQLKEAGPSVLAPYAGRGRYRNQGHRVVAGQRLTQAASDIFLGWITGDYGRHYYWRQLADMKGSAQIETMTASELNLYAGACGWALAHGHARSGDAASIGGYLGGGTAFDEAVATFAARYADQAERDHDALATAARTGRIPAEPGV